MDVEDSKRALRQIARVAAENRFDEALEQISALPETVDPRILVHREALENIIRIASGSNEPAHPSGLESDLFLSRAGPDRPLWILMGWTGSLIPKELAARLWQQKDFSLIVCFNRVQSLYAKSRSTSELRQGGDQLVKELKDIIREWKPSTTVFVGQSRFTFIAGYCAVHSDGDRVVLPSPLSDIDTELIDTGPGSKAAKLILRMRNLMPPEWRDCKVLLKDWVKSNELHVVYSEQMPRDIKQSVRLANMPNTHLHVHPDWPGHDILPWIMGTELIDRISGLGPAPRDEVDILSSASA